jgi:dTDP-4-dehydrorhamnose reductase
MIIGVTGANGQLGRELIEQGCIRLNGRLISEQLRYDIKVRSPDAIINCAAMTDVDGCETQMSWALSVNAAGVDWLSWVYSGYLIQVSTDYIFDGVSGPYGVRDAPNPLSVYGLSKLGGELAIKSHKSDWLIVRTTILFSDTDNNFVSAIVKQLRTGEPVKLYNPYLSGTPTYVPALAAEMIRIIKEGYTGVAHIAGNQCMTRLDFARLIAVAFGYNPDLIIPNEGPVNGAIRPPKAGLICDHSGYGKINSHDITDGLEELENKEVIAPIR